jgi:hypothetical protein
MLVWTDKGSSSVASHASGDYSIKRRGKLYVGEFTGRYVRAGGQFTSLDNAKSDAERFAADWLQEQLSKRYRRIVRYVVWGTHPDTGARLIEDIREIEIGDPGCWTPAECEAENAAAYPGYEIEKYSFTVFR